MNGSDEVMEAILNSQKEFVGDEQAIAAARKSPLRIDTEGNLTGYYGKKEIATELILKSFYSQTGMPGIRYTKKYLEKNDLQLPEGVETPHRERDFLDKIVNYVRKDLLNTA